ncbi:hypothetical protein Tco_1089513 [Tanacetum coccineum]
MDAQERPNINILRWILPENVLVSMSLRIRSALRPKPETMGKHRVRQCRKLHTEPVHLQYLNGEAVTISNGVPLQYSHLGKCGKNKNNTSDAVTKPTSSLDTSISDNESNILRCNNRLLNSISKSNTNRDIDDEVLKTIEVGSLLGFNLVGKEDMVRKTIGDSFVQS